MPLAFFQARIQQVSIDANKGIIRGCKIMELGKLACFAGEDGTSKKVTITPAHIDALLSHAGNRAIPSHKTHEWFTSQGKANADSVELDARIGALKAFRKDDAGDLIGDAHLRPGLDRDAILWAAENNPEDTMLSAVFSYAKNDPLCMPIDFRAVDFVPQGAAVTALFSADTTNTDMPPIDVQALIAALSDPTTGPALAAAIDGALKHIKKSSDADISDADAAAMESDAGVTDADKKKDDDQKPALMRAMGLRIPRAIRRQLAEVKAEREALKADRTAILAEAKVQAGAEATALLGKGGFIKQGEGAGASGDLPFVARLTKQLSTGVSQSVAILRAKNDSPSEFNAWEIAGRPMPKLTN